MLHGIYRRDNCNGCKSWQLQVIIKLMVFFLLSYVLLGIIVLVNFGNFENPQKKRFRTESCGKGKRLNYVFNNFTCSLFSSFKDAEEWTYTPGAHYNYSIQISGNLSNCLVWFRVKLWSKAVLEFPAGLFIN